MSMKSDLIDTETQKNVNDWLEGQYDKDTKQKIQELLQKDPKALIDAFYTKLSFGTAGLRGLMGVGTNRMNRYTVMFATQGIANYLKKQPTKEKGHAVLIGYDNRLNSHFFAEEAAKVLAANGITAYLFNELRPTPLISFGCRHLNCSAAIMITASHNPKEYNGYKVYWDDGGQILPPHDTGIIQEVNKIHDTSQVKITDTIAHPLIHLIQDELDTTYLEAITSLQHYPQENAESGPELKIAYTSLHGTGITLTPQALKKWGFSSIITVKEQCIPDGAFPTVTSPNPEERDALKMGITLMQREGADLLIANDPDADRIGVAVSHHDKIQSLNGNQIAVLCLAHICESGKMPENGAFIKTIVTTELFQAICNAYKKSCINVLTGFKYIAEQIRNWESEKTGKQFLFGAEESYGCLLGTYSRDKDAVLASALIAEIALQAKLKGQTLIDRLEEIYTKFGLFCEKVHSLKFEESKQGKEKMTAVMANLRENPPKEIAGREVITLEDYLTSTRYDLQTKEKHPLTLPKSNVLLFWLKDGSKVVIRPSGTEPKIKLYFGVKESVTPSVAEAIKRGNQQIEEQLNALSKKFFYTQPK